jgi:hypothetical protein
MAKQGVFILWASKKASNLPVGINYEEEAASAKLWAVYVSEAEKYDRGLVESWKSDMEGLLIFVRNKILSGIMAEY